MRTTAVAGITALSLLALTGTAAATEPTDPPTQVIGYSGAAQNVTVPDGVSTVSIWAYGGDGGDGSDGLNCAGPLASGGGGAEVALVLPVEPGQVLTLTVGGAGATAGCNDATESTGGWGGNASGGTGITSHGGGSSGGGGGATAVSIGNTPVMVAAGGGGGAVGGLMEENAGSGNRGNGGLSYLYDAPGHPLVMNGGAGTDGKGDGHGRGGAVGSYTANGTPGGPGQVGHDDGGDSGAGGGGWGGGSGGTAGGFGGGSGGGGGAGLSFANDFPDVTFAGGYASNSPGKVVLDWHS